MTTLPHDMTDLYLAPLALRIDARLEELGQLNLRELEDKVQVEANMSLSTPRLRQEALLLSVGYLIETHDWRLQWHPRGIQMSHDEHALVLGTPPVFTEYLTGQVGAEPVSA